MRPVRRVLLLLLTFTLLSACLPGGLVAEPVYPLRSSHVAIQDALWYLRGQQDADGSIGGYGDSAWACIAIAAAGEDPNDWDNGGPSLVDYLKQGPPEQFDESNMGTFLSRMVLAAVAAGGDPSAFGDWSGSHAGVDIVNGDYLSALKSLHDGTQFLQDLTGDPDSAATLNSDFWAVRALVAAGESPSSSLIQSSVDFIIDNQEPDGGWTWGTMEHSWYESDSSDVDNTAAALIAACLGNRAGSGAVAHALQFLSDSQHSSGGFASIWMGVNVQSTAWAIDAIGSAGYSPVSSDWTPVSLNPVDYLLASQESDGSIGGSVKATAEAIAALVGHYYNPIDQGDPPQIDYSPSRLGFEATEGGRNPREETLEVWNSGDGRLWWRVSSNADWLSLSPSDGDSTGEKGRVTVSVDIDGLDAGRHTGRITIQDDDDSDHNRQVSVTLDVEADEEQDEDQDENEGETDSTETYLLVTSVNPPGTGTISKSVASGEDGYQEGTTVTLTAEPTPGFAFIGWSGDADGSDPTATVTMSTNRSVTAEFLRFDASGLGNVGLAYAAPEMESVVVVPYPVEGIPSSPSGFRVLSAYVVQPEGSGPFTLQFDGLGDADNVAVFQVIDGAWAQVERMVVSDSSLKVTLDAAETVIALAYPGDSSTGLWERMTGAFSAPDSTTIIVIVIAAVLVALILLVVLVLGRRDPY